MANKHVKKYTASSVIRKRKLKLQGGMTKAFTRTAEIKSRQHQVWVGVRLSGIPGRNRNGTATLGDSAIGSFL